MTNEDEIFQVIVSSTRSIMPALEAYEFKPSNSLAELGADSVDRAEILMKISEVLDLQIPRVELFGPKTLGELTHFLEIKCKNFRLASGP